MPIVGGALMTGGVFAGMAFAEPCILVAALALIGLLSAVGASVRLWVRSRARFRYRRGRRTRSPAYWVRRACRLAAEVRDARPRWTTDELAALDDEASLEQLLWTLPVVHRERRLP